LHRGGLAQKEACTEGGLAQPPQRTLFLYWQADDAPLLFEIHPVSSQLLLLLDNTNLKSPYPIEVKK